MTYQETLTYLYECVPMFQQIGSAAYKEGLENTHTLDAHFGHPHRLFRTIHIAGTNGKGSCSHTLAAILQASGLRVGLYTSPHLIDFRERIRVNGQPVSEEYVTDFVARERSFFEPLHPSFFELTTAMAFDWFARNMVDVAVIEVGMGGRLDHTYANLQTLAYLVDHGARGFLLGGDFAVTALKEDRLAFPAGLTGPVSVFCPGEPAEGVSIEGLYYPLQDAVLTSGFPLGVSNQFTGVPASVSVRRGTLLVMWGESPASLLARL